MAEEKPGIEELKYMQQLYEQQYRMLSDSINASSNELAELGAVQKAVESSDMISNSELFTHLGSNFYIRGKAPEVKNFVVGIGGGYLVEMSTDYAKEYIARQMEKKSAELNSMMANRKKVEATLLDILHKIEPYQNRSQ